MNVSRLKSVVEHSYLRFSPVQFLWNLKVRKWFDLTSISRISLTSEICLRGQRFRRKVLNKLINFIACYRRCILKMSDVIAQSHAWKWRHNCWAKSFRRILSVRCYIIAVVHSIVLWNNPLSNTFFRWTR
jgi:hypothetical protein